MEYTIFGKTGRNVSRLGFGGASAGIKNYVYAYNPENPDERKPVIDAIKRALELGVTYFDTAAVYGDGISEKIFGEGLKSADPDKIFLATKAMISDGATARKSLERSLSNLGRNYVDLIQIHGSHIKKEHCDQILEKGGMLDTLLKAKDEGLVRHMGFSIECQNESLYRLLNTGAFDTVQVEYNLLFQHPYDPFFQSGSLYDFEEKGLGIAVMRTVTSGIFQKWMKLVRPDDNFNYHPALMQFVLSNKLVDVALLGMRSVEEVEENVASCNDLSGRIDLDKLHIRVSENKNGAFK